MTIRTVYHATDGEQFPSRAQAQHYERALEVLRWLEGHPSCIITFNDKLQLAREFGETWYMLHRGKRKSRKAATNPTTVEELFRG